MYHMLNVPKTPCYVVDEGLLEKNLTVLSDVEKRTGCKVLLALKGFAMFSMFPLIRKYLSGTSASSLYEARLSFEEFGKEVHMYSPAYREDEIEEALRYISHINFNSFAQWEKMKPFIYGYKKDIHCGLRINPEHSEVKVPLYDPCSPGSRLGIKSADLNGRSLEGIEGLHFHTLCELGADALERTLKSVEEKFGELLHDMKWINFGGGHHITKKGYDIDKLCGLIDTVSKKYDLKVYLEPGEAVVLNTGFLIASVLDIIEGETSTAILDTSAAAHMPDVIEMPYRPEVVGASLPGKYSYTYKLGGLTCLAGDIIGEYSFEEPLNIGDRLIFEDMAHYTMVKNNMFNGVALPAIYRYCPSEDKFMTVKEFGYMDYRNRLS